MRHLIPLLLIAAAVPSGAAGAATRAWPVAGFDRVDLAAAASVELRAGGAFALTGDGDADLLADLRPVVRAGVLELRSRDGQRVDRRPRRLHLVVTLPRLAGVAISGAGQMDVGRVAGRSFSASLGGAGRLTAPALAVERLILDVGGAGTIRVGGRAERLDARVRGVGSIEAGALAARAGRIDLSGTGSVTARVDGPVEGVSSGIGSVRVLGRARCAIRRSGLGQVQCGG